MTILRSLILLCAAWVSLVAVDVNNGTLFYQAGDTPTIIDRGMRPGMTPLSWDTATITVEESGINIETTDVIAVLDGTAVYYRSAVVVTDPDILASVNVEVSGALITCTNATDRTTAVRPSPLAIATFSGGVRGSPLRIVFNRDAITDDVRAVLRRLSFSSSNRLNPKQGGRTIMVTLDQDGAGIQAPSSGSMTMVVSSSPSVPDISIGSTIGVTWTGGLDLSAFNGAAVTITPGVSSLSRLTISSSGQIVIDPVQSGSETVSVTIQSATASTTTNINIHIGNGSGNRPRVTSIPSTIMVAPSSIWDYTINVDPASIAPGSANGSGLDVNIAQYPLATITKVSGSSYRLRVAIDVNGVGAAKRIDIIVRDKSNNGIESQPIILVGNPPFGAIASR